MKIPSPNDVTPTEVDVKDIFKPQPREGFSRELLLKTFASVKDKTNWKKAVYAEFKNEMIEGFELKEIVREAIIYVTGSIPSFEYKGRNTYIVRADGYYVGCPEY